MIWYFQLECVQCGLAMLMSQVELDLLNTVSWLLILSAKFVLFQGMEEVFCSSSIDVSRARLHVQCTSWVNFILTVQNEKVQDFDVLKNTCTYNTVVCHCCC